MHISSLKQFEKLFHFHAQTPNSISDSFSKLDSTLDLYHIFA